jgi:hypothetical protein
MASILQRRDSKIWTAYWRDLSGRLHGRSTGTTDRKTAKKFAEECEAVARKERTLRQMQRVLADMHKLVGGSGGAAIVSLRQHIENWLSTKEHETAPTTMAYYRSKTKRFLEFLGERADKPVVSFYKTDAVQFRDWLIKKVGANTTQQYIGVMKPLFNAAVEEGLVGDNPFEFLKTVKKEKQKGKRIFTDSELKVLLNACDPEWKSMVMFALYTGQRLMDVATLTWANVDPVTG